MAYVWLRRISLAAVCAASLSPAFARASTDALLLRHAAVGRDRLAYVESGRGEPLVLVHGGLQDYRMWLPHLAAFAQHFTVIAYSRRNHFPNLRAQDGLPDGAADRHGEDLAALVRALRLGPVHVVAHSSGAHAALFFAARHPDLVRTLSVNEPPATGLLAETPAGRATLAEFNAKLAPARQAFRAGAIQEGLRLFADGVGGPGTYDRRPQAVRRMMADNAAAHVGDALAPRTWPAFDCALAKQVAAPTLVTRGENSPAVFQRMADELERCLPRSVAVAIAGASHTVPAEEPEAWRTAVLSFIARQRAAR